jgi:hypothetical protein
MKSGKRKGGGDGKRKRRTRKFNKKTEAERVNYMTKSGANKKRKQCA